MKKRIGGDGFKAVECYLRGEAYKLRLKYLREQSRVSGYELTSWVNRDYGVLVSPGTIYSKLYSFERA